LLYWAYHPCFAGGLSYGEEKADTY
jgi:hypothetical protein